ncbi:MAG: diaminopimelate decarboxylase [Muribaculaceae bacterium]|nr:diaminopimelate decarboxylase [Muribaculaceae bacterium]
MNTTLPVSEFSGHPTPFYFYDLGLLRRTIATARAEAGDIAIHYAVKANYNPVILGEIAATGLGADCVSGAEVGEAIKAGIPAEDIMFAGVGKTDAEIIQALEAGVGCLNVESVEELQVIAALAAERGLVAPVALRVNPDIDAHTHEYITTGLEENKFGIDMRRLDAAADYVAATPSLSLRGLHFHIGSQITVFEPFDVLCERINGLVAGLEARGIAIDNINVGGGLGINYDDPDGNPIPPFSEYFAAFRRGLKLRPGQRVHCELGRAIVGQCGSLISRVLYVKEDVGKRFVIADAGMTELIRPALYGAHHLIQNLTSTSAHTELYDVVGPVCESSDCFGTDERLPLTQRGDLLAFRSAGAYGEAMASHYNCRSLAPAVYC